MSRLAAEEPAEARWKEELPPALRLSAADSVARRIEIPGAELRDTCSREGAPEAEAR